MGWERSCCWQNCPFLATHTPYPVLAIRFRCGNNRTVGVIFDCDEPKPHSASLQTYMVSCRCLQTNNATSIFTVSHQEWWVCQYMGSNIRLPLGHRGVESTFQTAVSHLAPFLKQDYDLCDFFCYGWSSSDTCGLNRQIPFFWGPVRAALMLGRRAAAGHAAERKHKATKLRMFCPLAGCRPCRMQPGSLAGTQSSESKRQKFDLPIVHPIADRHQRAFVGTQFALQGGDSDPPPERTLINNTMSHSHHWQRLWSLSKRLWMWMPLHKVDKSWRWFKPLPPFTILILVMINQQKAKNTNMKIKTFHK